MRRVILVLAAVALSVPETPADALERLPVVAASGAARATHVAPSSGNRYVMAPCWDARGRLVTVTEGPPAVIERRSLGRSARRTRLQERPLDGALSPTCGLLAELRGDGVWMRYRNGSTALMFSVMAAWETRPRLLWSRDESRLVVVDRETRSIAVLDVATGQRLAAVTVGKPYDAIDVGSQGVNADASAVLVTIQRPGGSSEVHLVEVATGRGVRLFVRALDGAFSPDSRHVAASRRAAIVVSDLQGRIQRRLADRREYRRRPAWSPDGKRLAFAYSVQRGKAVVDGVAVATVRTGARVSYRYKRRDWSTTALTWSGDGRRVAVTGFSLAGD